jgi:hypothetical protein
VSAAVPAFARKPYGGFSRQAAVAIAVREWRAFGAVVEDHRTCELDRRPNESKPEREEGLWQRVGEYRWVGLGPLHPRRKWTGKHDSQGATYDAEHDATYAWSAAFISYVMRIAGAGNRFPYDDAHSTYINLAARAARGARMHSGIVAVDLLEYAPRLGDLVCAGRGPASSMRFTDLPAPSFPSHCAIIVALDADQIAVIGGNVRDTVALTHVPMANGRLMRPNGEVPDSANSWFVAISVGYDA